MNRRSARATTEGQDQAHFRGMKAGLTVRISGLHVTSTGLPDHRGISLAPSMTESTEITKTTTQEGLEKTVTEMSAEMAPKGKKINQKVLWSTSQKGSLKKLKVNSVDLVMHHRA